MMALVQKPLLPGLPVAVSTKPRNKFVCKARKPAIDKESAEAVKLSKFAGIVHHSKIIFCEAVRVYLQCACFIIITTLRVKPIYDTGRSLVRTERHS
jgi:hypothetical protein